MLGVPLSYRAVSGSAFSKCIAAVAKEHREHVGAEQLDIAFWSRASIGKVSRFENAVAQPRNLDYLLLAYAKVCGISAVHNEGPA